MIPAKQPEFASHWVKGPIICFFWLYISVTVSNLEGEKKYAVGQNFLKMYFYLFFNMDLK